LENINTSSVHILKSATQLETLTADARNGKGIAGILLSDKEAAYKIKDAIDNIHLAGAEAKVLLIRLDSISSTLESGINNENGLVFSLLKDTTMTGQLSRSLVNIEKGTLAFSEDMEALKHNFLTRGYFKKKKK
jgi:phospholipid/cholesterol/gamma-HCH transport system substrate-binding protein